MARVVFFLLAALVAFAQRTEMRWTDHGRWVELRIDGKVEFTDDESDVKSVSPGGRFLVLAAGRRYEVTANSSGQLNRTQLDEAGRAWLRALIPEIMRESGYDAEKRVKRFLLAGGPSAVLTETGKIRSDGVRRIYLEELHRQGTLLPEHQHSAMRLVRQMHSDGERARLLIAVAPQYMKNGLREPFFEAVHQMSSDGERRRVLTTVIARDSSPQTLTLAARAAERMHSDGERCAVLIAIADHSGNDEVSRAFLRAAEAMHSDGERSRSLLAYLGKPSLTRDDMIGVAKASHAMKSDGERARVLVRLAERSGKSPEVRTAIERSMDGMHSEGEFRRVRSALR
jgi:hypothetical protein